MSPLDCALNSLQCLWSQKANSFCFISISCSPFCKFLSPSRCCRVSHKICDDYDAACDDQRHPTCVTSCLKWGPCLPKTSHPPSSIWPGTFDLSGTHSSSNDVCLPTPLNHPPLLALKADLQCKPPFTSRRVEFQTQIWSRFKTT